VLHLPRHILRRRSAWPALLSGLALLTGGCSSLHPATGSHWYWPWHHAASQGPQSVAVLGFTAPDGTADGAQPTQFWDRNALRIDLTGLTGQGEFRVQPLPGHHWPVRLELTAQPGRFATLQVSGEQRVVLQVPASGDALTFKLEPGVYTPKSQALSLRWGP
jgi:hypothetical protein